MALRHRFLATDLKTRALAPVADELRHGLDKMAASDRVPPSAAFTTSDARVENAHAALKSSSIKNRDGMRPQTSQPMKGQPCLTIHRDWDAEEAMRRAPADASHLAANRALERPLGFHYLDEVTTHQPGAATFTAEPARSAVGHDLRGCVTLRGAYLLFFFFSSLAARFSFSVFSGFFFSLFFESIPLLITLSCARDH
ncbi:MAG: hypothetical protein ABW154_08250, partial [Dyella sp.]